MYRESDGKKCIANGANVVITGRTLEKLEETRREINQDESLLCIQMDVRMTVDVERIVDQKIKNLEKLQH